MAGGPALKSLFEAYGYCAIGEDNFPLRHTALVGLAAATVLPAPAECTTRHPKLATPPLSTDQVMFSLQSAIASRERDETRPLVVLSPLLAPLGRQISMTSYEERSLSQSGLLAQFFGARQLQRCTREKVPTPVLKILPIVIKQVANEVRVGGACFNRKFARHCN